MDDHQFDSFVRSLTASRRSLLSGSLAMTAGWLAYGAATARKERKKKPKLKRNAFGCVDVGGKCRGNSANCCSGICEGKKPKKDKRDTSVCVAHDTAGICFPDTDTCTVGENFPCNADTFCICVRTTGNAGFCGGAPVACRVCSKDVDCQDEFGPGAACVVLDGPACSRACPDTGRTACFSPCP